jgi:hypothetical protein
MPILEGFRITERAWALAEYAGIFPGLAPRRIKTYILLV